MKVKEVRCMLILCITDTSSNRGKNLNFFAEMLLLCLMAVKTLFWIPSCRTQKDAALKYRTTKEQEVHEIEKVIYFFNYRCMHHMFVSVVHDLISILLKS
jgi:hypothetical protein